MKASNLIWKKLFYKIKNSKSTENKEDQQSFVYAKEKFEQAIPTSNTIESLESILEDVEQFEASMELRQIGKHDEKLFAETRLRRGVYGQRYDNGKRHDGVSTQKIEYPDNFATKGVDTLWHAPGMQRIKVPFGGINTEQLEVIADLTEEYSDGIAHITTRQDIQLHFIHIADTPTLLRRLGLVGMTSREACGNSVRNVTACPKAGCCRTEVFDITPYAKALTQFFLGHHDVQDFGRKFKIAFSGCKTEACGLSNMHDMGLIAKVSNINGKIKRGFEFYVGGGLGSVPHPAKLIDEFIPEEELLPMAQAVARVFSRLGEKKNRARARVKFLVAKLGVEEFRKLVYEERKIQPYDERWTAYLKDIESFYIEGPKNNKNNLESNKDVSSSQIPLPNNHAKGGTKSNYQNVENTGRTGSSASGVNITSGGVVKKNIKDYNAWLSRNVVKQKQNNYNMVTIKLPLGDITPKQIRSLVDISRRFINDTLRTTVEQNIVLRWIKDEDLLLLYELLYAANLAEIGSSEITDIVSCPGTDTCKLGISASRGLAGELRKQMQDGEIEVDDILKNLHIKISGCFNSCGQHHISDLGFYGVSRKINGRTVPHFQVVVGGLWEENGGSYGLPIIAIPSKNIPEVVRRLSKRFKNEKLNNENFYNFVKRIGKAEIKNMILDLANVPIYEKDKSYYVDWGDPREYTTGDMGVGECAGEVISRVDMDLSKAEQELFEAQLLLEKNQVNETVNLAVSAMLTAARGMVKLKYLDVPPNPEIIVQEFKKHYYETQLFFDPYAGGKFAHYFFNAIEKIITNKEIFNQEQSRYLVEEASLFIDACHSCNSKLGSTVSV